MTSDESGKPKASRYKTIYVAPEVRDKLFQVAAELQVATRKAVSMGQAIDMLIRYYNETSDSHG